MLVVVPVELAGGVRGLHEGVIEFARDLRAPVIAEATERLAKLDFVHVGSLAYSVHESVRVPIRFISRSNTALSSSERAMPIAPWMASTAPRASAAAKSGSAWGRARVCVIGWMSGCAESLQK